MITVTKAVNIDENEFSELFEENYDIILRNGDPFFQEELVVGREMSYDERRLYYMKTYNNIISNHLESDFVLEVRDSGILILLAIWQNGIQYGQPDDILRQTDAMGRNLNGNKLWYWGSEYCIERLNFLDSINANGFVEIHLSANTDLMALTRTQIHRVEEYMDVEICEEPYIIPFGLGPEITEWAKGLPTPVKVKYTKK
tara:strand:+ start:2182 stop:2781 length:600 start_codon:yes stop_codon:yes gene_type:complete